MELSICTFGDLSGIDTACEGEYEERLAINRIFIDVSTPDSYRNCFDCSARGGQAQKTACFLQKRINLAKKPNGFCLGSGLNESSVFVRPSFAKPQNDAAPYAERMALHRPAGSTTRSACPLRGRHTSGGFTIFTSLM